jgi:hypothetical protein
VVVGRRMLEAHMAECLAPPPQPISDADLAAMFQPVTAENLRKLAWKPDNAA